MRKQQILLIEHEDSLAALITARLERREQFAVDVASTGYDALRCLGRVVPDAMVVDTALPDIPATQLCRAIRSRGRTESTPLILISERAVLSPIIGLELGADDYLPKPFDPDELEARLKAVMRRRLLQEREIEPDVFQGTLLEADFNAVAVTVSGRPITLSRREFRLLRCLVHTRNQVIGRETLVAHVWGPKRTPQRTVDAAICRLRRKLMEAGRQIETVAGFGYRFNEGPERQPVSQAITRTSAVRDALGHRSAGSHGFRR